MVGPHDEDDQAIKRRSTLPPPPLGMGFMLEITQPIRFEFRLKEKLADSRSQSLLSHALIASILKSLKSRSLER